MTPAETLAKAQAKARRESLERAMEQQLRALGLLAGAVREHQFHADRRWRFDFAFPAHRLALEVEGGTWTAGRHTRGSGFEADCEKYALAAINGWRVIRATSGQVKDGTAAFWIEQALAVIP